MCVLLSLVHPALLEMDVTWSLTHCLCIASRLHRLPQRLDYTLIPAPLGQLLRTTRSRTSMWSDAFW